MGLLQRLFQRVPESKRALVSIVYRSFHPDLSTDDYRHCYTRNAIADVADRLGTPDPLIVDGGAGVGRSIADIQRYFRAPTVLAFEPVPERVRTLTDRFGSQDGVSIRQQALGASDEEVTFFINNSPGTSSVLPLVREYRLRDHPVAADGYEVRETITVRQSRLDSVLSTPPDVLKLDIQGYELEALRGCGELLSDCQAIVVEVAFIRYYEDQPLFADIDRFLRDNGFEFFDFYEPKLEEDGRLGVADAVYFDEEFFVESAAEARSN